MMTDPTFVTASEERLEILIDSRIADHLKLVETLKGQLDAVIKTLKEIDDNGCVGTGELTTEELIAEAEELKAAEWDEDSIAERVRDET